MSSLDFRIYSPLWKACKDLNGCMVSTLVFVYPPFVSLYGSNDNYMVVGRL